MKPCEHIQDQWHGVSLSYDLFDVPMRDLMDWEKISEAKAIKARKYAHRRGYHRYTFIPARVGIPASGQSKRFER